MNVPFGMRRIAVAGTALIVTAACGFAETKAGKITALSLDTQTNKKTVTVTLGDLHLPEAPEHPGRARPGREEHEKQELITLGSETVTFVLDDSIAIEPFRPDAQDEKERRLPSPMQERQERREAFMEERLEEQLSLGSLVQLVYADDGTTVQSLQLLPDMTGRGMPMAGGRSMMPPMGMAGNRRGGCDCMEDDFPPMRRRMMVW